VARNKVMTKEILHPASEAAFLSGVTRKRRISPLKVACPVIRQVTEADRTTPLRKDQKLWQALKLIEVYLSLATWVVREVLTLLGQD
jgi:hypothetical protein